MARPWSKLVWTRFLTSCFKILLGLKSVFEFLLRLTGPIFVVLGGGLISFAVYVHFTFVLPWYSNGPLLTPSLFTLIHLAMDIWLCIGIAWNYGKSVASRPLQHAIELDPAEVAVLQAASKTGSSRSNTRYCKYCTSKKTLLIDDIWTRDFIRIELTFQSLIDSPFFPLFHPPGQKGKSSRMHHCHVCNTYEHKEKGMV